MKKQTKNDRDQTKRVYCKMIVDNLIFFSLHAKQVDIAKPAPRVPITRVKKIAKNPKAILDLIGATSKKDEVDALFEEEEEEEEKRPREEESNYMETIYKERKKSKTEQKANGTKKKYTLPRPTSQEKGKRELLNPALVPYLEEMLALAKQGMEYKTAPWLKGNDVPTSIASMPTYVADVVAALDHFVCWKETQDARR